VPDLSGVPGVAVVEAHDDRLRCQVYGPVEPLLRVLAETHVTHLIIREPSLEELFLAHYGAEPLLTAASTKEEATSHAR
jgi:ABC-2 type transport system ATP-binding protein